MVMVMKKQNYVDDHNDDDHNNDDDHHNDDDNEETNLRVVRKEIFKGVWGWVQLWISNNNYHLGKVSRKNDHLDNVELTIW